MFREHAALSAFENDGARDFDIGALADVSDREHSTRLSPVQWPAAARALREAREQRFFADGGFFTRRPQGAVRRAGTAARCARGTSAQFPLRLNTGRVRDQWHTMTRTGLSPRLAAHLPEPFRRECIPTMPRATALADGGFARVSLASRQLRAQGRW